MDYQRAEQDLLLGVLDALPCPTALLNRAGDNVYTNERPCPIPLDTVDFASMPEVIGVLEGVTLTAFRTELHGAGGGASGLVELYPVLGGDELVGALVMFRPDPVSEVLSADALPTLSDAMAKVWDRIQRISMLKTPALFIGESGTGRKDFARALHRLSNKHSEPFVIVSSSDGPERLIDAALEADHGTLLCERIDKWSAQMLAEAQTMFASRHVLRGLTLEPLNARLVSTADITLTDKAESGSFPAELYARINIMPVFIPPLRDRREDIMPAAAKMAAHFGQKKSKEIDGFTTESKEILERQEWKGNLAELREVVEAAVSSCPGGMILASYLSSLYRPDKSDPGPLRKMREAYGRDHVRAVLAKHGHSVEGKRRAAEELGISLSTLYRVLGSKR